MRCPLCDRVPTYVLKTERPVDLGIDNVKRRRRRCRNCRGTFYTYEVSEDRFKQIPEVDLTPREKPSRTPLKDRKKEDD